MRKPSTTAPSVPLGRKMNPSKTSPQAKTDPPAKVSRPVKTSPPEKTSHPAKASSPSPQPKPAVTAVEMGAQHMRKPSKKSPSAKHGRKSKPSKTSPPVKTSPPAPQPKPTVTANGPGIVRQQIPKIFAKLLYGSKFHRLRMSRGQQGIGISAAGMYGQMTTGKSVQITSRTGPKTPALYFEVQIDTKKNEPRILEEKRIDWESQRGTQVTIEVEGRYQKGRASVDEYIEQTIIANPHVKLTYFTPEGETKEHPRTYHELPPSPREIKPHPYGIELGTLIKMLQDTKSHWLSGFLSSDFCRVSQALAQDICKTAALSPRTHPRDIQGDAAEQLYKAIQSTKIMAPPTNSLSPIGEKAILAGLYRQIKGDFYTAVSRPPA